MEITIFTKESKTVDGIAHFMDFYYSLRLKYLASDLLEEGLSPRQINDAVLKAISVGKSSRMPINEHFRPVFSGVDQEIISDCKLSQLGYGLVLMNADVELRTVGDFQLSVLQHYFSGRAAF